jgi:hypothetical protein
VRRFLIFVVVLLALGITTAVAASFDVSTEDIASFSTETSISVPDPPGLPFAYALRGPETLLPGLLDTNLGPNGAYGTQVNSKRIAVGSPSLTTPPSDNHFHSWETPPFGSPLRLNGPATLWIDQSGGPNVLTAGLFDCPPPSAPGTRTPIASCVLIAGPDSNPGNEGDGMVERGAHFRQGADTHIGYTIPVGHTLRVQVVNLATGNNQAWNIQWGYKLNRQARLELTVQP